MTPPAVLLDATFLAAVVDPEHDAASAVAEAYLELLDDFVAHRIRLRARRDHLATVPPDLRRTVLSPVQGTRSAWTNPNHSTRCF